MILYPVLRRLLDTLLQPSPTLQALGRTTPGTVGYLAQHSQKNIGFEQKIAWEQVLSKLFSGLKVYFSMHNHFILLQNIHPCHQKTAVSILLVIWTIVMFQ